MPSLSVLNLFEIPSVVYSICSGQIVRQYEGITDWLTDWLAKKSGRPGQPLTTTGAGFGLIFTNSY